MSNSGEIHPSVINFTYWREPAVRVALEIAGWTVVSIEHVTGRIDSWLYVLARA